MVARALITILLCLMALPAWATDPLMDWESGELATFVRSGAATYIDADGVLQTSAENEPRISLAPDGQMALLLEGAATNLCTHSYFEPDLDETYPGDDSAFVNISNGTIDVVFDEALGINVYELVNDTGSTAYAIFKCENTLPDVPYTYSIWGKCLTGGTENRVVNSGVSMDSSESHFTNEWARLYVTGATSASGQRLSILLRPGETVRFVRPQLEQSQYITSYMPTNGSAASRASETADAAGNGFSFSYANNPALEAILSNQGRVEFEWVPGVSQPVVSTLGSKNRGIATTADTTNTLSYLTQYHYHYSRSFPYTIYQAFDGNTYNTGTTYNLSVKWNIDGIFSVGINDDFSDANASAGFNGFSAGDYLRLWFDNELPGYIRKLAFYDAPVGGNRVAYWPFDGTEYVGNPGDDEKPQAGIVRSLDLKPMQAVPMRAFPLSVFP